MRFKWVYLADASSGQHKPWRQISAEQVKSNDFSAYARDKKDIFLSLQQYPARVPDSSEPWIQAPAFDFDCAGDPLAAIAEAQKLARWLRDIKVPVKIQRWNLSGNKGCHGRLDPYACGVTPSTKTHLASRKAAEFAAGQLGLKTLDQSIYSKKRVMRVVGSIHSASGVRALKIPTSMMLEAPPEAIAALASDEFDPGYALFDVGPVIPDACAWFRPFERSLEYDSDLSGQKILARKQPREGLPLCVSEWLKEEPPRGQFNEITFVMATAFKAMEWTKKKCVDTINRHWSKRLKMSTIDSGYRGDREHSCLATRRLGGACNESECQFIREDETTIRAQGESKSEGESVTLADAVRAAFTHKRLKFQGIISQQTTIPCLIPLKAIIQCNPKNNDPCNRCSLQKTGRAEISVRENAAAIAQVASFQHRKVRADVFRREAKIPGKCPGNSVVFGREENTRDLVIQPDYRHGATNRGQKFRENRVLLVGDHTVDAYHAYEFQGETVPWPKDDSAVHVCPRSRRISTSFEQFEMDEKKIELLSKFQPGSGESIEQKIAHILDDYERNLHRIRGRGKAALAVILTFHSAVQFRFMRALVKRGWIETLLFGDTAQGKSALVRSFMDLYQCGELLTGESMTKAGLLSGMDRVNGQWAARAGALVRNNRQLVAMDEYHEAPEEVRRGMSDARTDGVIKDTKIIPFFAEAMTRKLFLANGQSTGGRSISLDALPFGVQHVMNIMRSPEDVRRLDLALPFEESAAIRSLMNLLEEGSMDDLFYDQYSSMLGVHRSWSRGIDQIEFEEETAKTILHCASELANDFSSEIPLLDMGETKFRLCRISVALASLLISTDDSGEMVVVKPDHVRFVDKYLRSIYCGKDMGFDEYTKRKRPGQMLDTAYLRNLGSELRELGPFGVSLIDFLATQASPFSANDIAAIASTQHSRIEAQDLSSRALATLKRESMIEKAPGGFQLNRRGQQVNRWFRDFLEKREKHPAEFDWEVSERFAEITDEYE